MDRHECMCVGPSTDYRAQTQVNRIRCRAGHHHVRAALGKHIPQTQANLKYGVCLIKASRARFSCRWMSWIDGNCQTTQRICRIRDSRRASNAELQCSILPEREVAVGRAIQVDRIAYTTTLGRRANAVEI